MNRKTGEIAALKIDTYVPFGVTMVPSKTPNLVSSEVENHPNIHMPSIDLDVPCRLVPSKTPGHFHLYIDYPMKWRAYKKLLKAMAKSGIVEDAYYRASRERKASYLRIQK